MKRRGRRVVIKAGEGDGVSNMVTSGRVGERKAMSPITRFLESEYVSSPSNCIGALDKSPKSNAGAAHPNADVKSPGAVSSLSVTSEENSVQDLENRWNLPNREAKEVEQRWSLNDTLEMCVSEREREELSGLTNREGPTGTVFGDLKGKGLIKKILRENESPRNQLQKKLTVTLVIQCKSFSCLSDQIALPLGAFSPPQSSSTPKHPGGASGRAEVAVVRPTQVKTIFLSFRIQSIQSNCLHFVLQS